MTQRLGFALIGLGRHARNVHFPNILGHPQINLKYVVEQDTNMAGDFLKQYYQDDIKVVSPASISDVLEDKSVDASVICTPSTQHEEYIKSSLKAGKAVFCEKPVTTDQTSTQSCYDEARRNGQPLLCGFNRRFDPSIRSLHRRVQAGELAQTKCIRVLFRDHLVQPLEYLRTSGGIFTDCLVHDFDLITWFMRSLPSTVYAQGHAWLEELREFGDVDHTNVVMKFSSGAIASIDSGRGTAYGSDHCMEVFGTNGVCLRRDAAYPTELVCLCDAGDLRENRYSEYSGFWKESFVNELQHFVNVIQGIEDVLVTAEETMITAKMITACNESYMTGLPVHL